MGRRTDFFLTALAITGGMAAAAAGVAIPYKVFSSVLEASVGAPTHAQIMAQRAAATTEMLAAPLDAQIDNWYLKSRAYLNCKPPEREYWDFGDGLRDRNKIRVLIDRGQCKMQYGREPPSNCGYGACYVVACLVLSTVVALAA
jgi:hypothetical protein